MIFEKNNIFSIKNILVFALFIALLAISFWRLPYSPATWYDEGINAGIAKSLIQDNVYSLKVGPGEFVETRQFLITTNYPVLIPVALSLKFFGINFFAARLLRKLRVPHEPYSRSTSTCCRHPKQTSCQDT